MSSCDMTTPADEYELTEQERESLEKLAREGKHLDDAAKAILDMVDGKK